MKADQASVERARYVQNVFDRIAPRYDLMNRLMTGGQDIRWRTEVVRLAKLPSHGLLLDLGAGTGDLGREARRQYPTCRVVAADFTLAMMQVGQKHPINMDWSAADALHLPFPDNTFDSIISGFLLRNVTSLDSALIEMKRVLKPQGRWVALDTTRPGRSILRPFIQFHMHTVIPLLGTLITGQKDAYTYLPDSTENFLRAEELLARMAVAGYKKIEFRRRMFGTIAIHWGEK